MSRDRLFNADDLQGNGEVSSVQSDDDKSPLIVNHQKQHHNKPHAPLAMRERSFYMMIGCLVTLLVLMMEPRKVGERLVTALNSAGEWVTGEQEVIVDQICEECIKHYQRVGQSVVTSVTSLKHSRECAALKDVYTCSGYCPLVNIKNPVQCNYLPSKPVPQFANMDVFCLPPADGCPSYNAWLKDSLPPTLTAVKEVPHHLLKNFTLGGKVGITTDFQFRGADIGEYASPNWTMQYIQGYRDTARDRKRIGSYLTTELYPVLDAYKDLALKGQSVAVLGTEQPWVEGSLLEWGAANVTTIEYGTINSYVPEITTVLPSDYANAAFARLARGEPAQTFDSIWCYSSLEHDGLGRYSDPINPDGDLQTLVKISCMLKPGGLFFLAMPVSDLDQLYWNIHRLYGPLRIPLVMRHFHLVEVYHAIAHGNTWGPQPIFVLQNRIGCANQ